VSRIYQPGLDRKKESRVRISKNAKVKNQMSKGKNLRNPLRLSAPAGRQADREFNSFYEMLIYFRTSLS
jgi:hypothetical protein